MKLSQAEDVLALPASVLHEDLELLHASFPEGTLSDDTSDLGSRRIFTGNTAGRLDSLREDSTEIVLVGASMPNVSIES